MAVLSNERIISGSDDKTIKLWNVNSGECIQTLTGHSSCVSSVAVLSNDKIVSASDDKTIKIWNFF